MKNVYTLLLVFTFSFNLLQAQNFGWAIKGGRYAYDYGMGIGTDNAGNLYVSGKYEESGAFFGDTTVDCMGNHDIYLAKYSSAGEFIWVRTAGGVTGDYAHASATDINGNTYVACEIEGTVFFGSVQVDGHPGDNDIAICKYDSDGNLLWVKMAGGYSNDKALDVAIDANGNAYITGKFESTAEFEGTNITSAGLEDVFIAKYNSSGVFQWVRSAGGTENDKGNSIAVDATGNSYVVGSFRGTANFSGTSVTAPNGYADAFVAKYDTDGNLTWVQHGGGDYDDVARGVTIDKDNQIIVVGEFNAYAIFGANAMATTGNADIFITAYTSTGSNVWLRRAGGSLIDRPFGVTTDLLGNIYYTGQFGSTADFQGVNLTASDSDDVFVASMTPAGVSRFALMGGGAADSSDIGGYEAGNDLIIGNNGNVYVTGSYLNAITFNTTTLSPYSRTDMFLVEINQSLPGVGMKNIIHEDFVVYPNPAKTNVNISSSGTGADAKISVINILGEEVYSSKFGKNQVHAIDIKTADLVSGIYFIKLYDGKNTVTKKVIIE